MAKKEKGYDTQRAQELALLVGVVTREQNSVQAMEYLDELKDLVETAGARTIRTFTQKLPYPNPRTYIGDGKLNEIRDFIAENPVDMVVFDDELTPSQIRNIEKTLNCKLLDRSNLILDIFAKRARTAQARTQVELAQLQYMLPRLTRMWTHLQKQKGGIGMKGPGETEIETDRRVIRDRISKLKDQLQVIDQQNATRRTHRGDKVRVALVGYTNVGKSTLMNLLSKSDVLAENKLFATLDSTVRKVFIEDDEILLTDTVGFIRKLPHQLVECFKSTLDEVREADILLHVVDASHPGFEEQMEVVNLTLQEIGAQNKTIIIVFNKIDLVKKEEHEPWEDAPVETALEKLERSWMAKVHAPILFISAEKKINIQGLKAEIARQVKCISR